jgi:predicted dehydrogenase
MHTDIQVAVVGGGYWGANLIRVLHDTDGLWLKAVCDPRLESLQQVKIHHPQVALTQSLEDILSDPTIRAVFLATPPTTHYTLACAGLAAGKHVWVEKPLALSYQEGWELVALARATQRILFVDETFLYDPLILQARMRLAAGQLGKVFHVLLERTGMGRIRRDSNVWWNSAPHDLALLRYLLDSPTNRISATGHAFLQPGIEDVVWASLELTGGISAHLYLNWLYPDKKASLIIVGEHGMLGYEGRFDKRALTHYTYRLGQAAESTLEKTTPANLIPIEQSEIREVIRGDRTEPLKLACVAFRESILNGEPAASSGEHSLRTLALLEAGACSILHHGMWQACTV